MGALGVSSGVASAIEPDVDVTNVIRSANAKAEHGKSAAFYAQVAKDIDMETGRHKRMAAAYQRACKLRELGIRMK